MAISIQLNTLPISQLDQGYKLKLFNKINQTGAVQFHLKT